MQIIWSGIIGGNLRPETKGTEGDKPTVRPSMEPSHAAKSTLINLTHEVWQPRIRRKLTDEDARQMAANVTGFFAILAEWSRAVRPIRDDDSNVPAATAQVSHER